MAGAGGFLGHGRGRDGRPINGPVTALGCALLAAAGFGLSLHVGSVWALAWIAPVPVLWFAAGPAPAPHVFAAAWLAYAAGMLGEIWAYAGVLPIPLLAVILIGPALLFAVSIMIMRRIARKMGPIAAMLGFAAVGTGFDYLLAFGPDGPAVSPAYSQVGAPFLIQGAAWFGPFVVTFLLGFVPAGLALSVRTRRLLPCVLAACAFLGNAGFGVARMDLAVARPVMRVGLAVDDTLLRESVTASAASASTVGIAYGRAARTLTEDGAGLIVLPEKLAIVAPGWRDAAMAPLREAALQARVTVVAGFEDRDGGDWNEALVLPPSPSAAIATYRKRHLVPGWEGRFSPGNAPLVLPDGTGIAICKDMDFPSMLRADARAGHPTLVAVPAWDFGADGWLHARMAILRGVEEGFAVARAARDGLLTLSDAYGRVVATAPSDAGGMVLLVGDVRRGPGDTVYGRIGDVFAFGCIALSVVLVGLGFARRPRPGP